MPVKIGDRVYYKIGDGTIKTGIYENPKGKGRGRVKLAGGKFAMPPKSALHHTRKGAMSEVFAGDKSNKDPILGAKPGPAAAKEKAKAKAKNEKKKPKPPVKKERRKTYYAGYDRLAEEEMEMMESDGWKESFQYGDFTVLKRLMSSLSEDAMEVYENAPYRSIGKKLVYGNRQDFKLF
tara:strand:+ start:50 stop:586 length:537 start_codon:yes stop_codon:yes gene_type:complete